MSKDKLHVYYDGLCNGCSALATGIAGSKEASRFELHDAVHTELPDQFTKEAAMKDIHVVDETGTYKGSAAIVKIMEQYPGWRWIAWIAKLPVLKHIAALCYRLIADNRYWMLGRKNVS